MQPSTMLRTEPSAKSTVSELGTSVRLVAPALRVPVSVQLGEPVHDITPEPSERLLNEIVIVDVWKKRLLVTPNRWAVGDVTLGVRLSDSEPVNVLWSMERVSPGSSMTSGAVRFVDVTVKFPVIGTA